MEDFVKKEGVSIKNDYPIFKQNIPKKVITAGHYQLQFAVNHSELEEVQMLRYAVFHAQNADDQGIDSDHYDTVFHHSLVRDMRSNQLVGTYRMQTIEMAQANYGFYSNQEYCLNDFPDEVLVNSVEIGRACVDSEHRNGHVLRLLWRSLGTYLTWNNKRYLFGCSSLFSQSTDEAYSVLDYLERKGHTHPSIWVNTRSKYSCKRPERLNCPHFDIPKLLRVYMTLGAKVCSPPAIDKEFESIDYLTLFDLGGLKKQKGVKYLIV